MSVSSIRSEAFLTKFREHFFHFCREMFHFCIKWSHISFNHEGSQIGQMFRSTTVIFPKLCRLREFCRLNTGPCPQEEQTVWQLGPSSMKHPGMSSLARHYDFTANAQVKHNLKHWNSSPVLPPVCTGQSFLPGLTKHALNSPLVSWLSADSQRLQEEPVNSASCSFLKSFPCLLYRYTTLKAAQICPVLSPHPAGRR